MASPSSLPVGKLPPDLLAKILSGAPLTDPRVLLGPGVGLDCAVVDLGDRMLVFKSDPITFASEDIGWYAVQVCANDVATTGAEPRWLLATALLPEDHTPPELAEKIAWQIFEACRELGISVIGGHTEITHGIDRPILSCTMIGEVQAGRLVTPRGAVPGDRLLLTKGVPVEAVSIIAREFADRLGDLLSLAEVEDACRHLYNPGISVVLDARLACHAGRVHAMHDPTEGGLASALWELSQACGHSLQVDLDAVPVLPLAKRICAHLKLDPLACIASGALLLAVAGEDAAAIRRALEQEGIACAEIGQVCAGPPRVMVGGTAIPELLPIPQRDELAKLFSS
jgi:hydrogenase expression/formation protein HypE